MNDITKSLEQALRADPEFGPILKVSDEIEGQVKEVVEFVDLTIAFSPVLPPGANSTDREIIVDYVGTDGRGVVKDPYQIIPAEQLKEMRARWLVVNGREKQPAIDRMFNKTPNS